MFEESYRKHSCFYNCFQRGSMQQMAAHTMMQMPGYMPGAMPQGRQFSSPNSAFSPVNTFPGIMLIQLSLYISLVHIIFKLCKKRYWQEWRCQDIHWRIASQVCVQTQLAYISWFLKELFPQYLVPLDLECIYVGFSNLGSKSQTQINFWIKKH